MIRFVLNNGLKNLKKINKFNYYYFSNININRKSLLRSLNEEFKNEKDNYVMDDSIKIFLKEKNWKMEDKNSCNFVILNKVVENTEVKVLFFSRQPPPDEENSENQDGEENQETEENENYQENCEFFVYVKGEKKNLVFNLFTIDGELSIQNLKTTENIDKHIESLNNYYENRSIYNGPDFNYLDQNLLTSFVEYLSSLGIDEELATFIEHVSLDKEQRLYINWLEEVKNFFE